MGAYVGTQNRFSSREQYDKDGGVVAVPGTSTETTLTTCDAQATAWLIDELDLSCDAVMINALTFNIKINGMAIDPWSKRPVRGAATTIPFLVNRWVQPYEIVTITAQSSVAGNASARVIGRLGR
jgi:hypothetical protein